MGKGRFVFLRGSLCGPECEAVHERGKSPQWGQTSGYCFPVLRAGGLENLKSGAGPLRAEPAFCERQQMAVLSPGEQQHCSVMAKHSKLFSLDDAVTAVLCSKCSSRPPRPSPK